MENYLAIEFNKLIHKMIWMMHRDGMLSEKTQLKNAHCVLLCI